MKSVFFSRAFPEGKTFSSAISKNIEEHRQNKAVFVDSFVNWALSVVQRMEVFDPFSLGRSQIVENTRGFFQGVVFGETRRGGERFSLVFEQDPEDPTVVSATLDQLDLGHFLEFDEAKLKASILKVLHRGPEFQPQSA